MRKPEPEPRELRRLFEKVERGLFGDPQIDFRVVQLQVAAGGQRHAGQQIRRVASGGIAPAEHERLAVIPLLHTDIKAAVAIERQEEFGQPLERFRLGQPAGIEIGLQIISRI